MEVKPGYQQTEVGVIPEEWEVVTATDACELVVDCKNRTPPVVPDSDFAVVRTPNVRNGQFVLDELRFTDEESYRVWTSRAVPQLGDIMITREAPLGEVCAVPPNRKVCLGQRMMLYRPSPDRTSSNFLLYSLMSEPVRENLFRKIGGSTVGHAKVDDIRFLQVPLPPLPEQRAIAEALSDVDGLLGGLDRLIAKKRDLKQAAMQQLLTGQTRLPGFHGEWEVKRLDEIADVIDPHPSHRAPDEVSNGVPFVGIGDLDEDGNLVGSKLRYVDRTVLVEHAARYNLDDQLIGLGRVASIGKVVCLKPLPEGFAISPTLGVIRGRIVQRGYLLYALRSKFITAQFTRIMSGSTRSSVGMEVLRKLNVLLPPTTEEQTAIATVLSEMDGELAVLEQRREKTRALKQAMMQELLTGRTRLI